MVEGQAIETACRRKMRMSGLCKVEMSAFMGGRGPMETERMALSQRERDRLRVLQDVQQGHLTQVKRQHGNAFVWFIRICSIPIARSINPDDSIVLTGSPTPVDTERDTGLSQVLIAIDFFSINPAIYQQRCRPMVGNKTS